MGNEVRWGILGTGLIAGLFTPDLVLAGHKVVAVGSRSKERAGRFAAQFGIPNHYASYEEFLADPDIDIVYIATPHPSHVENALAALDAGKHVLVEKPFTVNAAQAQSVVDRARQKGLVALEAMWTRFLPHMVRIREIVRSGSLGDIESVVADHTQKLSEDPAHRLNALEPGGGALLDLGIYPISFAWDLLGPPVAIQAMARFKATGADAQVATVMRHRKDAFSLTVCASDTAGPNTATVIGKDGRIDIDSVWYQPTTFRVYDSKGVLREDFKSHVSGRGMQYQAAEAERLIKSGTASGEILSASETVSIMATLDAIREQIGLRYPCETHAHEGRSMRSTIEAQEL